MEVFTLPPPNPIGLCSDSAQTLLRLHSDSAQTPFRLCSDSVQIPLGLCADCLAEAHAKLISRVQAESEWSLLRLLVDL